MSAFEPASSHDVGAPSAVIYGSRAQAQGRIFHPALDSSAVEGVEGERESARERSSLCGGAPKGAGAGPLAASQRAKLEIGVPPSDSPHDIGVNTQRKGTRPKVRCAPATLNGPGLSNTRGQTPPGQSPPLQTPPGRPMMLQHGVDTLHVVFRCEFPVSLFIRLQRLVPEKGMKASVDVNGESFEAKRAGEGYKLTTVECAILVHKDPNGFHVKFEAGALMMRRLGLNDVCRFAQDIVEGLAGQKILEHRVRRADLFMDVAGVSFVAEDLPAFVSRARKELEFHTVNKLHHAKDKVMGTRLTGFSFSPGNVLMVRLYDKLEELNAVAGEDSAKYRTEIAAYSKAGWTPELSVWRLEAQLRTPVLKKRGVQTMDQLREATASIWEYCFSSAHPWLRLAVPGSATRVERQKTDERWTCFQDNPFAGALAVQEIEDGDLGGVSAEQTLGVIQSFLGSKRELDPLETDVSVRDMLDRDLDKVKIVLLASLKKTRNASHQSREAVRSRYRLIPKESEK